EASVRTHVIAAAEKVRVIEQPLEQKLGTVGGELFVNAHAHRHHPAAEAVKKFAAGVGPGWLLTTPGRDLLLRSRSWKRPHINLVLAGLVRGVSDPVTVGRKCRLFLGKGGR